MKAAGFTTKKQALWDDRFYVEAYRLACSNLSDTAIATSLGVSSDTFKKWLAQKPALAEALQQARSRGHGTREFMRYVVERLPEDIKPLWNELSSEDEHVRLSAYESVKKYDRRKMQYLWLHATIACNFNERKAERMIGINHTVACAWKRNDKGFKKLLEMIHTLRGDFGENALMEKIAEGDTASIIFFNKSYNRDRGYDSRVTVDVKGEVEHKSTITVKELPLEQKLALLEEIRRKKQAESQLAQIEHKDTVDVEFSPKDEAPEEE